MRIKPTLIRGIAGLALTASVFLGCQDFPSEDKAAPTATTPSEDHALAAQETAAQDSAGAEPAPAQTTPDNFAECKDVYTQMLTAKEPLYGELKNRLGELKCDVSKVADEVTPFVPPDSATVCKNLRSGLATMDPNGLKYASYQQEIALKCPANP